MSFQLLAFSWRLRHPWRRGLDKLKRVLHRHGVEAPKLLSFGWHRASSVGQDGILQPIGNRPSAVSMVSTGRVTNPPQVDNLPHLASRSFRLQGYAAGTSEVLKAS